MDDTTAPTAPVHDGAGPDRAACADPLHSRTSEDLHWTTANLGEAAPGAQTPLSWTLWADSLERAAREGAFWVGAITHRERAVPREVDDRYFRVFHGRAAAMVEYMTMLGDRMPGTTGQRAAASVIGQVPADIDYRPSRRRYPVVAWRLPRTFLTAPRTARAIAGRTDLWYHRHIAGVSHLDLAGARALFRDAQAHLDASLVIQGKVTFAVVQPLYTALAAVIERAGVGDIAVLSGSGGAEMSVVSDIWNAAQGRIDLHEVARRYGFHGPAEGELSSRVWREDPTPLQHMVAIYAARPDPHRNGMTEHRRAQQAAVLQALPLAQRPGAWLILRLAETRILIRGVAKRAFVQSFDMARAAARRIGDLDAETGALDAPADVFYLTVSELLDEQAEHYQDTVRERRALHDQHRSLRIPEYWQGTPETVSSTEPDAVEQEVIGTGVSAGIAEGVVRVVTDPSFEDVEPGEILVTSTTDPSWSSIMYVSAALVVDIGGALSHAAVVARELAIPCVVSTGDGTRVLRTGDRVRVDGTTGTVTVLQPARRG